MLDEQASTTLQLLVFVFSIDKKLELRDAEGVPTDGVCIAALRTSIDYDDIHIAGSSMFTSCVRAKENDADERELLSDSLRCLTKLLK